jgi:polyhydroxyalkanoate synthase
MAKTHSASACSDEATEFAKNMTVAAEKCQKIMQEFVARQAKDFANRPVDPLNIGNAFLELTARMMQDPAKLWDSQKKLLEDYAGLWQHAAEQFVGEEEKPYIEPESRDRRFKDESWQNNAVFDFLKQSYLLSARWLQHTVHDVSGLDKHTKQKIDFYTRQFVDAMSPSNFLLTNPEVLKTTLESHGENLVKGLENLLHDLERGGGNLRISMTDANAFKVGKNLATTKGKVVYKNDLIELIQYEPTTKEVYKTPLLIIPAWINKYYILDLQQDNSVVKWLVDRGHTVFIISWVNPDEKLSKKTFEDYLIEGPLAAMDIVTDITGEEAISIAGYCLGGTLLSITLAWLAAKKQSHRVKSATYLTTMIDFTDAGELSVFIDDEQLKNLESRMSEQGYLEGSEMAGTFNMLRANDLIWSFVVNNYLLGRDPFPFDLLYWNSDSTRMPAAMHSYYLRNMYQKNLLVKPGALKLGGVSIDLAKIKTPAYILATREDHIAPWKSSYAATQIYKGPIHFVLAASGHIAGVVNPPTRNKYCYWVGDINPSESMPHSPDFWLAHAKERPGSWWPDWEKWQKKYSGPKVPARKIGGGKIKPLADAPGSYVKVMV